MKQAHHADRLQRAPAAATHPHDAPACTEPPAQRPTRRWRARLAAWLGALGMLCAGTAHAADVIIPAYFYPSGTGATAWNTLATTAPLIPLTAILNPASGPGTAVDPNYTTVITNLRAAGGKVIAYVHTSYGKRALSAVTKDIQAYLSFYTVDGFFIDEVANDGSSAHVQYYQSIYNYIKGLSSAYQVVDNPGANIPQIYASLPVADRFVVFENTQAAYAAYAPAPWQANYPPGTFISIVYGASALQMVADLALAITNGVGGVYVTSLTLPNPYDGLPSYWSDEVSAALGQTLHRLLP
jgi:hypothetical protein